MTHISIRGIRLAALAVLALGVLAPVAASAGTYYVTPTGAGIADGSNWANAFSNLQNAVNAVVGAGDVIRLKAGTYSLTNALAITAKPGFTLAGGYAGGEDPDALSGDPSILKPAAAGTRVVTAADTTFTLERLTVAQGNITGNGGGIYLTNCVTTLRSVVVRENAANGIVVYGGAIYAKGGALTLRDSTVSSNRLARTAASDLSAMGLYGAGLYCQGVSLSVSNTTFCANGLHDGERVSNYNAYGYGGGLYVDGGSLAMRDSLILDNYVQNHRARNGKSYGGGLYANNTNPLRVSSTRFSGNGCQADCTWPDGSVSQPIVQEGGALYLAGSSLVAILDDCVVIRNAGVAGVGGAGDIRIAGGSVAMTNCLVALNAQGGVSVAGGSVAIANSTVADNTGWGIRRTGGTVSVKDSIVWGNMLGGIDGAASVSFSCTQEVRAGNQNSDPLLVGDYYLSAAGLPGQTVISPCINAGSGSAATLGLGARTTQTDGVSDGGVVDLGYHYATAFGGDLLNRFLFVDAVNGDDVNNQGRVPGSGGAFKTIRKALSVAVRDTVITLAAGDYNAASGESFPLTVADAHLTLQGAGPNATRIDAGSAARALFAVAPGRLKLAGLTVQNGRILVTTIEHATLRGAGLHALGGDLTVSNCQFKGNSIHATITVSGEMLFLGGAGIFITGGGLKLIDSSVILNTITRGTGSANGSYYGGGVYAEDTVVTAQGTSFVSNRLDSMTTANYYFYLRGAAMYLRNGSASLSDCAFTDNRINLAHLLMRDGYGAALCAERTRPVTIRTSTFSGNWAGPLKSTTDNRYRLRGGTIFLFNSAEGVIDRCSILNGDTALYSDDHGGVEIDYVGGGNSLPITTATLRMTNCLVAANADSGVAVRGVKGRLVLENCTVAGNKAWGVKNNTVGAQQTIRNSIVWGNASGGISNIVGDTVNYTLAQAVHPGTNNKLVDPLFVAPGMGNYRLREGSPAWNAGLDAGWMVATTDLDDNPRLAGPVDLGCYELPPPGGTILLVR